MNGVNFVCPACGSRVVRSEETYRCDACGGAYPIFFGIPDFRLRPDPYLSFEDERAKATKLELFGRTATFAALVAHYYRITDDVPSSLLPVFTGYVLGASERTKPTLEELGHDCVQGNLLDLGCGSGGSLLAAADIYASSTGVDIALRWLVIAKKRLTEAGIEARLVCANAEALPFPPGVFTHVLANDLIDNVDAPDAVLTSAALALAPGGRLWLSAGNRRWIGPHPATGVWAAGLAPARWRKARLERKHGFDLLRAVSLQTSDRLRRVAGQYGLSTIVVRPRQVDPSLMRGRSHVLRVLAHIYRQIGQVPGFAALLIAIGPAFEILFTKSHEAKKL